MTKKKRSHRVQILRVAVALLLGLTISVVVAWRFSAHAIAQRKQAPATTWNAVPSGKGYWTFSVRRGTGWTQIDANASATDLPASTRLDIDRTLRPPAWSKIAMAQSDDPDSSVDGQAFLRWTDVATGWPMLALRFRERTASTHLRSGAQGQIRVQVTTQYGYEISDRSGLHNILPLRPVWPGFIVNMLLFAVPPYLLLVLVGSGIAMIQRRRRLRRGCCTACGYDLAGLDGSRCPECGASDMTT
jgi:hypothetical protein